MNWKIDTTLASMPFRAPLEIWVNDRWEATTPYDLMNGYRFPRFLSVEQIEFTMGTHIRRVGDAADLDRRPAFRRSSGVSRDNCLPARADA